MSSSRASQAPATAAPPTLAARQRLLADYLNDPALEAEVRAQPLEVASRYAVPARYAEWLAQIEPRRVEAFRRTQTKKRDA